MTENEVTAAIIGAAIEVHRRLGPGLLETVYRRCLAYEASQERFRRDRGKAHSARLG